jgi:hypothetical protein
MWFGVQDRGAGRGPHPRITGPFSNGITGPFSNGPYTKTARISLATSMPSRVSRSRPP